MDNGEVADKAEPPPLTGPAPLGARRSARPDPGRLLLARLLSTLCGLLLGFVIASVISLRYTGPFRAQLAEGEQRVTEIQKSLAEPEREKQRLTSELSNVTDQIDRFNKSGGLPRPQLPEGPSLSSLLERHDQISSDLEALDASIRPDKVELAYFDKSLPEYRRDIANLDLSSAALVLILTMLGFICYPLMLGWINRMAVQWEEASGGAAPRSPQVLIGFFAGIVLAVVILLALFSTFTTSGTLLDYPFARIALGAVTLIGFGLAGALAGVIYFTPGGGRGDPWREYRLLSAPKLLDTSVLIDGRVHEVAASGFLDGCLVVTHSVLRELQNLADSGDGRRRVRGRRGLELLQAMQKDPRVDLRIMEDLTVPPGVHGTDELLIAEAQEMGGVVVTNDFNLNRVAAIRDVRVININALNNAVKPQAIPGELLEVEIVDRGKQRGQGVGYLPDGTMVVVEDGEGSIKQIRTIKVTSVTQTAQGRMIFGRIDLAEEEGNHA